eukprot:GHUV01033651.1.p1 GENE.GHUV01033651.1~~GHUV01033651.1.p1  ORF type:complete len:180 (+),score=58.89 GHUV01033651.1:101-640(+)
MVSWQLVLHDYKQSCTRHETLLLCIFCLQGFKESVATSIEIPNIDYETFTTMMRYIYVGSVEVETEQAMPLLQAADQYLLEGLKRLCEATLAQSLTVENLADVWAASEDFCAPQLAKRCVLFALEHCTHIINADSAGASVFTTYMPQMVPALRSSLVEDLNKVAEVGAAVPAPAAGAAV